MRTTLALLLAVTIAGCSLRNEVALTPIFIVPSDVRPDGTNVVEQQAAGEFGRAIEWAGTIDAKERPSAKELWALGSSESAAGRLEDARRHLRAALDLRPTFDERGDIAWALAQTEYLANNYAAALEWSLLASESGVGIRQWHFDYLEALAGVQAFDIPVRRTVTVPMRIGSPEIPRIDVALNGREGVDAVIDTGAVMSIVSETMAETAAVRSLGDFRGTFLGLLGEPIPVRFGLVDSLRIGELEIANVPVAIMPDDEMKFFVRNRRPFRMDLLLGTNLLKEFRIELDFRREVLSLQPLTPAMRRPDPDQNLFFVGFRPFVQATINRKGWYLFVVDTGSEVTFLNLELLDGMPIRRFVRYHGATLQGLGGARKRGEKIEDVEIGIDAWGGRFKNLPLYASETANAYGILGQNFMQNFRVVMDFGAMRLDLYRDRGPFRRSAFER
ncbi:MAG: retroviral-like aspartic protease family protein [Thermoanaerobaculia bacterium]